MKKKGTYTVRDYELDGTITLVGFGEQEAVDRVNLMRQLLKYEPILTAVSDEYTITI